jgi:hypothetical protein
VLPGPGCPSLDTVPDDVDCVGVGVAVAETPGCESAGGLATALVPAGPEVAGRLLVGVALTGALLVEAVLGEGAMVTGALEDGPLVVPTCFNDQPRTLTTERLAVGDPAEVYIQRPTFPLLVSRFDEESTCANCQSGTESPTSHARACSRTAVTPAAMPCRTICRPVTSRCGRVISGPTCVSVPFRIRVKLSKIRLVLVTRTRTR